jgi:pantoate--beta-alanine ligase
MRIIKSSAALVEWRRRVQREGVAIGFVPTMGALHDGHRALIRTARLACDAVVVSIFVNPLQFGRGEDFSRYPRMLVRDAALCRKEGVDVVFAPSAADMYPPGSQSVVSVPKIAKRWEGARRPGHFDGVATVVTKLFALVRPDLAVFGQKDYQQALVVRQVIEDLSLGVRLFIHPTVRDPDGLALSSRNAFLSAAERRRALVLFWALSAGRAAVRRGAPPEAVNRAMRAMIRRERSVQLDYLAACDAETLEPATSRHRELVLLGAVRIGRTRLIDNLLVSAG